MTIKQVLGRLAWPLKRLSEQMAEEIAEKAAIGARAALAEAPLLDDLLDGKPVTVALEVKIQLKRVES